MRTVADTSFVIALELRSDKNRGRCLPVFKQASVIYLPQSVLNEVCYLLTRAGGNSAASNFLKRLPDMKYTLEALLYDDILRTAELLDQYADSRVDFVDASIAAVAERLAISHILTLDYRDFHILRPRHAPHFEILPQA